MRVAIDVVKSATILLAAGAYAAQLLRWLRVLQREHYEPGAVIRFWFRWTWPRVAGTRVRLWPARWRPFPSVVLVVALAALLYGARRDVVSVLVVALFGLIFPRGLSWRGRTSPITWTRRLRTVSAAAVAVSALTTLTALAVSRPWIVLAIEVLLVPVAVDVAARLTAPLEDRAARQYVTKAHDRLEKVHPRVVALTGSFGKTSTKHHLAELLGGRHGVVPSPRSFNNRAGLSRAINENLADDTKIFLAEMGTYGPGEIAALCEWCRPDISVITAIGPVHLERMKSLDVIDGAKFEITTFSPTVILNGDDERLRAWCAPLRAAGKIVRTGGSSREDVDVRVVTAAERWQITIDRRVVAIAPPVVGIRESNLACAIAAALALGLTVDEIVGRLAHLTAVANRMVVATAPSGVMVIDDTFNANPVGARSALATLTSLPIGGRRVVVTPGMVELGPLQESENEALAEQIFAASAELVVVGRTNAKALLRGYGAGARRFDDRSAAVAWVRESLAEGDGVLYLNDLPDHYP